LTPPFIFIVGYGRSGTTLLRAMLDAHPLVAIPDESHFVVPLLRRRSRYEAGGFDTERFLRDLRRYEGFRGWNLEEGWVDEAFREDPPGDVPGGIRRAYAAFAACAAKPRYGDKTPIHALHIPLLAGAFPEARFLHLVRDGRDVASSYLAQPFGPRDAVEAAVRWKRAVRRGRSAGRTLGPSRYLEVRYEELVAEPERILRSVCQVVELPFDPAVLRYHESTRVAWERPHYRSVARPPTPGLRDWRRDLAPGDLAAFEVVAGRMLEQLGYPRAQPQPSLADRSRAAVSWMALQSRRARSKLAKALRGRWGQRNKQGLTALSLR
jgi:Sulfotransferase family